MTLLGLRKWAAAVLTGLVALMALPSPAFAVAPNRPTFISPTVNGSYIDTVAFSATATDADGNKVYINYEIHGNAGYTNLLRTLVGPTVTSGSQSNVTWPIDLNRGQYYVRARATDTTAANSTFRNLGRITVNRSPAASTGLSPSGGAWVTTTTPTLTWTFVDPDTSDTQANYRVTVKNFGGTVIHDSGTLGGATGSYTLPAGILTENANAYTWSVSTWDNAGAAGASAAFVPFKIDTTAPTGTVLISGGTTYTNTTSVMVDLTASDATSGVSSMAFSNDNATWSVWEPYAPTKAYTLPSGDGPKTVYARFRDNAGNVSPAYSDSILLDTTAPAAAAGGLSTYMTTATFPIPWTGSDGTGSGVQSVKLYYSMDNGSSWIQYGGAYTASPVSFTAPGEGGFVFSVRALDQAGNEEVAPSGAGAVESSTTVDTASPTGNIRIDGNAAATNTPNVTLTLSATDVTTGPVQMQFSDDGTTWQAWEPYNVTRAYTLPGSDGSKTVYVKYADGAGNASGAYNDSVLLDTTAPTATADVLAAYQTTGTFAVTWSGTDGTGSGVQSVELYWSADGGTTWNLYGGFASSPISFAAPGDGPYAFSVRALDAAGNAEAVPAGSGSVETTTTVDTISPTGTLLINAGAQYTASPSVTLSVSATDAAQVRFSDDGVTWSAWEGYATTRNYTLPAGDGTKTVYAQFQDTAGNVSTAVTDAIAVDTTSPTGSASVLPTYQTSTTFALPWMATDGTGSGVASVKLYVSTDAGSTWTLWGTPFATSPITFTSSGDGPYAFSIRAVDAIGNEEVPPSGPAQAEATTTVDTGLPTGTITIAGGAVFVNATTTSLDLTANDSLSGLTDMRFSDDGATWTPWVAFAATQSYILPAGDGTKTVYAQFRDAAGNLSASVSDTVELDTSAPSATALPLNPYQTSTSISVDWVGSDAGGSGIGGVKLYVSTDGGTSWTQTGTTFTTSPIPYTAPGEGTYAISVRGADLVGNEELVPSGAASIEASTIVDATPPTGSIGLNGGATVTNSTNIAVTLTANDAVSGVSDMRLSSDGLTWTAWEPFAATRMFSVPTGDGIKTVSVQFRDAAGNASGTLSNTIELVTIPPVGTADPLPAYQSSTSFNIAWSASAAGGANVSGVKLYYSTNNGTTWTQWGGSFPSSPIAFATPGDGNYAFSIRALDNAGNEEAAPSGAAAVETTTKVDTQPPTGTISINSSAPTTNTTGVTLGLSASDPGSGVARMRFSADGTTWSAWQAYAISVSYSLAPGDGTATVYAQFEDGAGKISAAVSDTIQLDTTAPTGTASSLPPYVATQTFSVAWTATDGAGSGVANVQLYYSTDGGVTWVQYGTTFMASPIAFTAGADGPYAFSVRAIDIAGNAESLPTGPADAEANTILDTTIPAGSVVIDGGAPLAASTGVLLTLSAASSSSTVTDMHFSNNGTTWTPWEPYNTTRSYTVPAGDGLKTVYVEFRTAAGTVSPVASDDIMLDNTPPTSSMDGLPPYINSASLNLGWTADDGTGSGVSSVKLYSSTDGGATWTQYGTTYTTTPIAFAALGDGPYAFFVRPVDVAGNEGPAPTSPADAQTSTVIDTVSPTGASIVINGGSTKTVLRSVTLDLSASDMGSGLSRMRFSNDGSTWAAWESFSTTKEYTLPAGDGVKTIYVEFEDAAGNSSGVVNTSITLDTASAGINPPSVSITAPSTGGTVSGTLLVLVSAVDDTGIAKVDVAIDGIDKARLTTAPYTWSWDTTQFPNGARTIVARATDTYGNVTTSEPVIVLVDNPVQPLVLSSPISAGALLRGQVAVDASGIGSPSATKVNLLFRGAVMTGLSAPFTWTWDTTRFQNGTHRIDAKALDAAGTLVQALTLNVTIDNILPTVRFTAPAPASFIRGTTTVTAAASDNNAMRQVDFYLDGTLVATRMSGPYSWKWDTTTASNGPHVVQAKAYDKAGNIVTSVLRTTVDNLPPTVALAAPSAGGVITGTTLVSVTASDNTKVTSVEFYVDGRRTSIDSAAPFAWNWNTKTATVGAHTLTAIAIDAAGNRTPSAPVAVTVNKPPAVSITAPTKEASVRDSKPVTVTVSDDVGVAQVEYMIDGSVRGTVTSAPYTWTWDTTTTSNGYHSLAAKAYDTNGVTTTTTIRVFVDNAPAAVSITSPADGAGVARTVSVTTRIQDNRGAVKAEFYLDGSLAYSTTAAPFTWRWDTTALADGSSHTVTVKAFDAAGNSTTSLARTFIVDNAAPTVSLTTPAGGATVISPTTVTASAADNLGISKVSFYVDGVLKSTVVSAPYNWTFDPAAASNGSHTLTARAYDLAGNATLSAGVAVIVDKPPTIRLSTPRSAAVIHGSVGVSATATDATGVTQVEFYVDGILQGTLLSAPFTWTWDTATAADGSHTLIAKAYDAAGNRTDSTPVTVTVDNTPPSITLTTPASATVVGTVAVTAVTADNRKVTRVEFYLGGVRKTIDSTGPFSWSWNTKTVSNGTYTLTAKAYDETGNVSTSTPVTVTVSN